MSDNQENLELPSEGEGGATAGDRLRKEVSKSSVKATFVIFGGIIIVATLAWYVRFGGGNRPQQAPSQVAQAPTQVNTTPGQDGTSDRYNELAKKANNDRADDALKTGKSSINSILNEKSDDNSTGTNVTALPKGSALPPAPQAAQTQPPQQPQQPHQPDQAANTAVAALMKNWSGVSQLVVSNKDATNVAQAAPAAGNGVNNQQGASDQNKKETYVFNTGDLLIGVTDIEINTDDPSNLVRAVVVDGPHKGGVMTGQIKKGSETVELDFTTLKSPLYKSTLQIKGVAMDVNTARAGIAGDVDKHYLLRYGSMFASAFISGYAQAIGRSNTTTTVSALGGQTTSYGQLSGKDELYMALGKVGDAYANSMNNVVNTPNTIMIPRGTMIGVQIQGDVKVTE